MTESEPRTVYHDDDTTVTECDGTMTFTFGRGGFKTDMTATWDDLTEMVRFAIFPLGGVEEAGGEIAAVPRYIAERADR